MQLPTKILLSLTATAALGIGLSIGLPGAIAAQTPPPDGPNGATDTPHNQRVPPVARVAQFLGLSADAFVEQLRDGATPAQVIESLGQSPQAVIDHLVAAATACLEEDVAAGRLDAERAAARLAGLPERVTSWLENSPGNDEERPQGRARGRVLALALVAETIGITAQELSADLRAGESITEIAEEYGSSVEAVVAALSAHLRARLDAAVEAGRLTPQEADEKFAEAVVRIRERVFTAPQPRVA